MEWNQLESDPGLFTLLLEDFEVKDVQVEEVYDLTNPLEGHIYGLVFLFKWQENSKKSIRRTQRSLPTIDPDIFFAQQVTPNSCATHALLSILLNQDSIEIGERLWQFKEATRNLSPRILGLTMGHYAFLYEAHNKHAAFHDKIVIDPEKHKIYNNIQEAIEHAKILDANSSDSPSKAASSDFSKVTYSIKQDEDSFHFVCFLPIKGQLYELDGLKSEPICHGKINNERIWTKDCFDLLQNRIRDQKDQRYNLMALMPDSVKIINEKIQRLTANKSIIDLALKRITGEESGITICVPNKNKRSTRKSAVVSTDQSLAVDIPAVEEFETESNHSASNSSSKRMTTRSSTRKSSVESSITPNSLPDCNMSSQGDSSMAKPSAGNDLLLSLNKETMTQTLTKFSKNDIQTLTAKLDVLQKKLEKNLSEEIQRKRHFTLEDARRVHNYNPFIMEFIKSLRDEQPEVFEEFAKSLTVSSNVIGATSGSSSPTTTTTSSNSSNSNTNNLPTVTPTTTPASRRNSSHNSNSSAKKTRKSINNNNQKQNQYERYDDKMRIEIRID